MLPWQIRSHVTGYRARSGWDWLIAFGAGFAAGWLLR